MNKQTLRPAVFEILKKTPQTHFHAIENDLRKLVEEYERGDVLMLQEILWELLVQGVLAPGKNSLNLNLPFVHVTGYGAQCLEDGRILAHDTDHYVEQLSDCAGKDLDGVILQFVRGALGAFQSANWASSIILLARAAEVLFDQTSTMLLSVSQSDIDRHKLETSVRFTRSQAQEVIHILSQWKLPTELSISIEPQLNGLLALLQISRDQDGSPLWPQSSRDQVMGFLLLFPEQCAFAYHLMSVLEGTAAV